MPDRRIFVSATVHKNLDERRRRLKDAVLDAIRQRQYTPQEFFESGLPMSLAWNFENVDRVMRSCLGAVVLGFARWELDTPQYLLRLVGEYNHYEGAVAISHRLPILLLAEEGVENRGIVWNGAGKVVTTIPKDADAAWVQTPDFKRRFEAWINEIGERKDVFLGYCSQNSGLAAMIEAFLVREGATVLNYQMDFRAGNSILSEIQHASARTSAGIFLFGRNDPLEGQEGAAAPRDNVVFEAGYFMATKGPDRCLVIREGSAKMPADLGGAIYLPLRDFSAGIKEIQLDLQNFLRHNL